MNTQHQPQRQRQRAFSLIEVLVSVTILAVLVVILSQIMASVQRMWLQIDAASQRQANGRLLVSFIVGELQAAAMPRYPATAALINSGTAPINTPNFQFIANVTASGNSRVAIDPDYLHPHAIFWQAPAATDKRMGNVSELGYFVRWDSTTTAGVLISQLCRFQVDAAAPSGSGAASGTNANFKIYDTVSGTKGEDWLTAAVIDEVAPGSTDPDHNYRGAFGDNVLSLWVRCLDADGEPITKDVTGADTGYAFDSNQGYTDSRDLKHPPPCLPPMVEIAIVTIDSRTAMRLTAASRGDLESGIGPVTDPQHFWYDLNRFVETLPPAIKPGARVYSTIIKLPNAP